MAVTQRPAAALRGGCFMRGVTGCQSIGECRLLNNNWVNLLAIAHYAM